MRLFACHKLLCSVGILLMLGFKNHLNAQNSERITLSLNNASFQKLISSVESQTAYRFVYTNEQLQGTKPVTVSAKDMLLKTLLDQCFQDQPLEFTIEENHIILRDKPAISKNDLIDISGNVKNERGDPVSGATVSIAGSDHATSTASDGSFILKQIPPGATLIFSGVDVETKQISVHGQKIISVILKTKTKSIDEVQVIGYGTTTRRLNTGDASTVSGEIISQQPVMNTLAALEGRVAGLVITQENGIPGSGFHVQIRGQNSITSGNDPLYVIDGVPFNSAPLSTNNPATFTLSPFNNLNPADIESVTILKDADATAIYGSRGANGVILIETKKSKGGKTTLGMNIYTGAGQVASKINLLNTPQYLAMRHEAFLNDSYTPDPASDPDILVWDTTRYTDWQKLLIGNTMHSTDAQISLSGGSANTQFLIGGNFHKETTVFPGDYADKRGGGHLNISHYSSDKKFYANLTASFSADMNQLPTEDLAIYQLYIPPDAPPVYDSAGKLNWAGNTWNNPMARTMIKYNTHTDNLIGSLNLSYLLLPGLSLKTALGYTGTWMNQITEFPDYVFNPSFGVEPKAQFGNYQLKTWNFEPQIQYVFKAGPGKLDLLGGLTLQQTSANGYSLSATGYSSNALLSTPAGAKNLVTTGITEYVYKYAAIFGRINYNIADELILNLTGRRDGSSRFGPGKQFANFGALGAAWIFTKLKYFSHEHSFLSFGKIRTSYGSTGNDQIGNYQYLSAYGPSFFPYENITGLLPQNLANPDYGWEVNKKFEAGLDLGFLKDRILVSASYYRNRCSNQIVAYPLPGITGYTSITANLPATVQNTGLEFELNASVIRTASFTWKANFNISFPKNQLISFPGIESSQYADLYVVGAPLNILKLYSLEGVDPKTGLYQFTDSKGQTTFNPAYPIDTRVYDFSTKYYGGLSNSFLWHGWQLDIFFQFTKCPGSLKFPDYAPGQSSNQGTEVLQRWQQSGDQEPIQRYTATFGDAYISYANARYALGITDASFLRLKNISLSWQFSDNMLKNLHLASLRLYVQAQNLLTLTSYQGLDPETQGGLPPIKLIVAGIQLSL